MNWVEVIWTAGLLPAILSIAIMIVKKLAIERNSQALTLLADIASNAVQYAEKHFDNSEVKHQEAEKFIADKINKLKISKLFSENDIDAAIESAVAFLNKMEGDSNAKNN